MRRTAAGGGEDRLQTERPGERAWPLAAPSEAEGGERVPIPEDTWRTERARHSALRDLMLLTLGERPVREDRRALIDLYLHSSSALAAQGQVRHDAGNLEGALDLLRVATMYLQRALAAAGVALPNDDRSQRP